MTRPDKSRALYVALALTLAGSCLTAGWYFGFQPIVLVVLGLLLLVPGRIPSFMWSEFYAGQHQMRIGNYENAGFEFERFLHKVRTRPWLKKLIYLKWGIQTWDIEAMTLNSLGSTFVERGELGRAASWFEKAIELDPLYAIPYSNLAVVHYELGADELAARMLKRAYDLGNRRLTQEVAMSRGAILRNLARSKR